MVLTNNIEFFFFFSRGCPFSSSSEVHNVSNNLIYKWKQQSWKHPSLKAAKLSSCWNLFVPQSRRRFHQSPRSLTTGNLVLLCIREQLHFVNDFHISFSFSCIPSPAHYSSSFSFFSFRWLTDYRRTGFPQRLRGVWQNRCGRTPPGTWTGRSRMAQMML